MQDFSQGHVDEMLNQERVRTQTEEHRARFLLQTRRSVRLSKKMVWRKLRQRAALEKAKTGKRPFSRREQRIIVKGRDKMLKDKPTALILDKLNRKKGKREWTRDNVDVKDALRNMRTKITTRSKNFPGHPRWIPPTMWQQYKHAEKFVTMQERVNYDVFSDNGEEEIRRDFRRVEIFDEISLDDEITTDEEKIDFNVNANDLHYLFDDDEEEYDDVLFDEGFDDDLFAEHDTFDDDRHS
ncbi:unnamed protein product [Bathycoccus prasinos]